MVKCKNCRWWNKNKVCDLVEIAYVPDNESPKTDFCIEVNFLDDQGLQVRLKTGPEFGCTLGESNRKDS